MLDVFIAAVPGVDGVSALLIVDVRLGRGDDVCSVPISPAAVLLCAWKTSGDMFVPDIISSVVCCLVCWWVVVVVVVVVADSI
jgi:hypothetical protein